MNKACVLLTVLTGAGFLGMMGCKSVTSTKAEKTKSEKKVNEQAGAVDVGFLLGMDFAEAKNISPKSLEMQPNYKFAADEITVLSQKSDGTPRRVRAKGHVFLQIDFKESLIALAQEALISRGEVILRGKPLLRRGRSVVEGLDDRTVFYIDGVRLQVIGLHRLTRASEVTPTWRSSWKEGPNPLLPALSPEDVPKDLRVSPLLPPLTQDDAPKLPE